MTIIVFFFLLLFVLVLDVILIIKIISDIQSARGGAPFVGIPIEVAREALKLAKVNASDIFYDLGCGDGRVLRLAAKEFSVHKAIGYEIGWWPYLKAKFSIFIRQLADQFSNKSQSNCQVVKLSNCLTADISEATVVFFYLYPKLLEKLVSKLANELPDGACIITCRYPLPISSTSIRISKKGEAKGIKIWVYGKFVKEGLPLKG